MPSMPPQVSSPRSAIRPSEPAWNLSPSPSTDMPALGNRGLIIALAGIALLLVSTLLVYRTPAARGPDAAADAFSALRAKAIVQDLAGSGVPHPIGSPDGARTRQAIVKRLSSLGYAIELQSG